MKATAHGAPCADLNNMKWIVVRSATDVDSNLYWSKLYIVLPTVFPELLALRLDDSNKSNVDKIYYYVHKATLAIKNNEDYIDNPRFFLPPEEDYGEIGYDYPDYSTEESDYDEDVVPGDDLGDSDGFSNRHVG